MTEAIITPLEPRKFFSGIWRVEGELGLLLPMGVALLNFIVVKSVFSQDSNHPAVFMMLGGVVALGYRATVAARSEVRAANPSSKRPADFGGALPALSVKRR